MKSKRRRRYKKKKYDFFLISKIALICYLAIFGVGYMSSDTSAFFSSQSEVSQIITAGIWEVPEVLVNACGEEYTIDEESESNGENGIDCEDKAENLTGGLACPGKDGSNVAENEKDAASSKKDVTDCKSIDEPKEEKEIDKVTENVEIVEQNNEKQDELEDGSNEVENENKVDAGDTTEDEQPKSNDESQKQPDVKGESVSESKQKNPTDESTIDEVLGNSIDIKKTEMNDAE